MFRMEQAVAGQPISTVGPQHDMMTHPGPLCSCGGPSALASAQHLMLAYTRMRRRMG